MKRLLFAILAVFIIATVALYAIFARDMTVARARLVGRSTTIETSFGTLEYAVMGEGEPMLIVHGAEGGFDQGIDMTSAMAGRGHRIIVPSRFGYLRSAMPSNPTTARQADAYAQLLDHLRIDKVVVVGISAGAWSSMQFAILYPERCRALVLFVSADYLPVGTTIHGGAVVSAMVHSNFAAWALLKLMPVMPGGMTQMMLGTDSAVVRAADPGEKARVQQVLDHLLPVSQRIAGMNFDIKTAATHEPYPIEKIACPVLTVSAEDDRFGTARRAKYIAASVPDGRAIIFPTGGHALVGHYADALREIASFLQTVQQRRMPR
ncbi:MAG: alpha/beta hydrolase [Terriglobales bacterium]|jgi:2-hydroxy-6-oxonona-2,4-dienedioate hydrolase